MGSLPGSGRSAAGMAVTDAASPSAALVRQGRGVAWASLPLPPFLVGIWSVVLLYGRNTRGGDPGGALLPPARALLLAAGAPAPPVVPLRRPRRAGRLPTGPAPL